MTAEQIRAARALLRWDQATLAKAASVSVETIKRLERIDGPLLATKMATIEALRRALEDAGVEFIPAHGGGPGVRLKARPSD